MAELTVEFLKLQEYAEALEKSSSCEFFKEYILTDKTHVKNLYGILSSLPSAKSIKAIDPANITYLDCVIYSYLIPIKEKNTSVAECYQYYLYKKLDKKHYYSKYQPKNGRDRIASVYLDDYINENWLILQSIYESKEDANIHIIENIQTWYKNTGHGGAPLVEYPLLTTLSSTKLIKFFLLDVGIELFNYISSIPDKQQEGTILPANLLFQKFIGMTDTNITADFDVDTEGNLTLYSEEYNTVFSIFSGAGKYESLPPEEQEKKLGEFLRASGVHNSFPNITCEDFTNFLGIINSFTENDYINGGKKVFSLEELTKTTYTSQSEIENKRKSLMRMLGSIHKWGSYRFNIENEGITRVMGFMSAKIGSENPEAETETLSSLPEIKDSPKMVAGFHFDQEKYNRYNIKDLCALPVTVYLDPLLIEEREKYVTQAFFSNIYSQIRDQRTRILFSYIYNQKMKNLASPLISFSIKDLQESFVIGMRPARFVPLVIDSLQKLKTLNAISKYSYAMKTFSVYIPEIQKLPD